jgi:hypothetical protein
MNGKVIIGIWDDKELKDIGKAEFKFKKDKTKTEFTIKKVGEFNVEKEQWLAFVVVKKVKTSLALVEAGSFVAPKIMEEKQSPWYLTDVPDGDNYKIRLRKPPLPRFPPRLRLVAKGS